MKKRPRASLPSPRREDSPGGWFSLNRTLITVAITLVAAIVAYRSSAQFNAAEVLFVLVVVYGLIWLGEALVRRIREPGN